FSSRRRHTRSLRDWSSDVCSSDLRWDSGSTSISDTTICTISMPAGIPTVLVQASVVLRAAGTARAYLVRNGVPVSDYYFGSQARSEERRVGKECRSRGAPDQQKKQ